MSAILLGITGGIAAYKSAELARLFVREGNQVRVIMTSASTRFVAPLTFQTLTGNPVYTDLFLDQSDYKVKHIDLLDDVSAMVVAPATANTIGKIAGGLADNLLTTICLAAKCPIVIVPSMNTNMYENNIFQTNLSKLAKAGYHIMDPETGQLACGTYGRGRMSDPIDIYNYVNSVLASKDFRGVKALVTAGPTREPFDPVRFISNPSTGLMGYEIAKALNVRGASVKLISGPTHIPAPPGVELIKINTAAEMEIAVLDSYPVSDLVIKAAAVSDFRPVKVETGKVKKNDLEKKIEMEKTTDILKKLGEKKKDQILVGFAAESEAIVENAITKLKEKNLDLIIVNNITDPDSGFAVATNRVSVIDSKGSVENMPLMKKDQLANHILDEVKIIMHDRISRQ